MKNDLILTKTVKGKKFLYQVFDSENHLISKRLSGRDYVACTMNGKYYFGRLDLVLKGDHLREVNYYREMTLETFETYKARHLRYSNAEPTLEHFAELQEHNANQFAALLTIAVL